MPFASDAKRRDLTPNSIRDYVDHLRDKGLKAVTCNKILSSIKAMLWFAEERGYVAEVAWILD